MSALVIGKRFNMASMEGALRGAGFDEVYYKDIAARYNLDIGGFSRPDVVILINENLEQSDIHRLCSEAVRLDVPVFIW